MEVGAVMSSYSLLNGVWTTENLVAQKYYGNNGDSTDS